MKEDPLFASAHAALTFAFHFSEGAYDRPVMNRMADTTRGEGSGLAGLDGAAQAGMVRQEIQQLGPLKVALLIARSAPPTVPCDCKASCCSGHKFSQEWQNAISYLADHVRRTALAGCTSNSLLRREYVLMQFAPKSQRPSFSDLAAKHGVDRHTVAAHAQKVATYFGGSRSKKGRRAAPGIEEDAMKAAEDTLRACGLI
jgi:hypothetical protein